MLARLDEVLHDDWRVAEGAEGLMDPREVHAVGALHPDRPGRDAGQRLVRERQVVRGGVRGGGGHERGIAAIESDGQLRVPGDRHHPPAVQEWHVAWPHPVDRTRRGACQEGVEIEEVDRDAEGLDGLDLATERIIRPAGVERIGRQQESRHRIIVDSSVHQQAPRTRKPRQNRGLGIAVMFDWVSRDTTCRDPQGRGWRARRDSNPRPSGPQPDALSTELRAHAVTGGEGGIRTLGAGYPTRRFSKPLH